jgi:hypothetical protein
MQWKYGTMQFFLREYGTMQIVLREYGTMHLCMQKLKGGNYKRRGAAYVPGFQPSAFLTVQIDAYF